MSSVLDTKRSNTTYRSRLTRWLDRLLPYQSEIVRIPGKDMGIVDFLSRQLQRDPWPESELDKKFVVIAIDPFHKALDCMSSRLENNVPLSTGTKTF